MRSKSGEMLAKRCSYPQAQREGGGRIGVGGGGGGGGGRSLSKTQLSIDKHFYDEPSKEGDLHYMVNSDSPALVEILLTPLPPPKKKKKKKIDGFAILH